MIELVGRAQLRVASCEFQTRNSQLATRNWRAPVALAWLLLTLFPAGAQTAEKITWRADRQPLSSALAGLAGLTDATPGLAYEVATGASGTTPITLSLRQAGPATVRQAIGHAAGLWWVDTPEGLVLTSARRVPLGALSARSIPSALLHDPQADELVPRLLEPWRTGGEILHDSATGAWIATLDTAGHVRLIELLSLLQLARSTAPPLFAENPVLDQTKPLSGTLHPGSWSAWCDELTQAADLSVSLEPGLDRGATAPAITLGGTRAELPRLLAGVGLRATLIRGVCCIGQKTAIDQQHPALRRRLAAIPLPHVVTTTVGGQQLAEALRRQVMATTWSAPGWGLEWIPTTTSRRGFLLIAADPPTIHAVLDAVDVLDRLGLADGLPALAH